jgi:hypothetical protein
MNEACSHSQTTCLNPFELIRKYRCSLCGEVMMCACDETRGRTFLPHQLSQGTELATQDRVPVTIGFQAGICTECRGMPAEAHPVAAIHGRTSKITRYYWRELFFREAELFEEWRREQPTELDEWGPVAAEMKEIFHKKALGEIKARHQSSPTYRFAGSTQEETLKKHSVEVIRFDAEYLRVEGEKKVQVLDGGEAVSVETFVRRHFERLGAKVLEVESVPFHVLFGTFLFPLIQDPDDPKLRMSSFGDREAFEKKLPGNLITTFLPGDFGSQGYGQRRAKEIEAFFDELPLEPEELLWCFDYCLQHSENLRQYLWAHRPEDIRTARGLLESLPGEAIHRILKYLVGSYWERFVGWPDLLVVQDSGFKFVEVKSSKDKLSEEQQRWIRDNHGILGFPFAVAKVHRATA